MKRSGIAPVSVAVLALSLAAADARADGYALVLDGGLRTMSNSPDTERAIFGSKKGLGFGFGVTYDRGPRLRLGLEVRRIDRRGERAFAADRTSEAFRLGHPLTLGMTGGLASIAFRFARVRPVLPYVALAGGVVSWNEESNIAGLIEKSSGTNGLFEARVGVERQQGRLRFGLEGGVTFIPNAVGVGGISQVYEESDLGGAFVVARLGFSRR